MGDDSGERCRACDDGDRYCPVCEGAWYGSFREAREVPRTLQEVLEQNRALVAAAPAGVRAVYRMNREFEAREAGGADTARFMATGWRETSERMHSLAHRAATAEAERDALRERVRVLEAVAVAARREGDLFLCDAEDFGSLPNCNAAGAPESLCMPCALRVAFAALDALDAAETDTREPDDGKVRVSLVEAVKLVKSLPDPSREVKRISEWNRLYREQRGGDR